MSFSREVFTDQTLNRAVRVKQHQKTPSMPGKKQSYRSRKTYKVIHIAAIDKLRTWNLPNL